MDIRALIQKYFLKFPLFNPGSRKTGEVAKLDISRIETSATWKGIEAVPLNPYGSTSIAFEESACDAVKAIVGTRFLKSAGNIPMLPLPDCGSPTCSCKYIDNEDRRENDQDRRLMATTKTDMYENSGNPDRRTKTRGRRKTDISNNADLWIP